MKILNAKKKSKDNLKIFLRKLSLINKKIKDLIFEEPHVDANTHAHAHTRAHTENNQELKDQEDQDIGDLEDEITEEIEFNSLEHIKEFFEDYIGNTIIFLKEYRSSQPGKALLLSNKIIRDVSYTRKNILIKLSSLNGKNNGHIKIYVGDGGMFVEKNMSESESKFAKYRIEFIDGNVIEYVDRVNQTYLELNND
jgi:predicted PilT family ATPase